MVERDAAFSWDACRGRSHFSVPAPMAAMPASNAGSECVLGSERPLPVSEWCRR